MFNLKNVERISRCTILILGSTSYLGRTIICALSNVGANLVCVVRNKCDAQVFDNKLGNIKIILLSDLIDDPGLHYKGVDVVFNFITCYGKKLESASFVFNANFVLPLMLAEAANSAGVKHYLTVDTVLPRDVNLYAMSKAQFTEILSMISFDFMAISIVRCDVFYGPFEIDEKRLPTMLIKSMLRNDREILLSKGEQKRFIMHVYDLCAAIGAIVEKNWDSSAKIQRYDVGPDERIAIRDFALLIKKETGASTELKFGAINYRPNELMASNLDQTSIRALGWRPCYSIVDGLRQVIKTEREE